MHTHLNEKDCCKTGALCFTLYFWLQPEEFRSVSLSQRSLGKRAGTSWTGCQSKAGSVHRDRKPFMLIFIPMACLESWCPLSGESSLERTHKDTGGRYTFHTERPKAEYEPRSFLLWYNSLLYNISTLLPSFHSSLYFIFRLQSLTVLSI